MRRHRRGIAAARSAALVAVSLPALAVLGTAGPAHAVIGSIAINEVESDGPNGDWVELTNNADFEVDISEWQLRDNDDTHPAVTIPKETTIAAGGFYMVYIGPSKFALGGSDTVTLYLKTGTPVDSYTWTSPATTTYGLCPDGNGGVAFATTILPTPNAANLCSTEVWPGSSVIVPSDVALGNDVSGVAFDPADASTLWVVRNSDGRLLKLKKDQGSWGYADGWTDGVDLKGASGGGILDAEGVVVGPDGAVYVSSERDQDFPATSKNAVLRYDVPDSLVSPSLITSLNATREWDLPDFLVPALDPNKGLEGLTWVPDEYLTSNGFKDKDGNLYDPASYTGHGTGLFVAAHEGTGQLYVLALDHTNGGASLVATIDPGLITTTANPPAPHVADAFFDDERQQLWAVCDNDCGGQTTVLKIANGAFAVQHAYDRPTGMDDLNNEGFAIAPPSGCDDGFEEVVWAQDRDANMGVGHSLRSGTLECTKLAAPVIYINDSYPEYGDASAPVSVQVSTNTGVVPTGTVTCFDGQNILGTSLPLGEIGQTSVPCSTTSMKVGNNSVTVRYNGDGTVAKGTAKAVIHLAKASSGIYVPPDSTVAYGKAATIPVTVETATQITPTGTVGVYDGNHLLGTAELVDGDKGTGKAEVMLVAGSLPVGVRTLSVRYSGDEFTKPAPSFPYVTNVTLTVTRASATVTAAGSSVASGRPVSIPVAVSAEGVVPSGTVTVKAGPTTLGSATLVQGTATVDLAAGTLALGAHDLTVNYTGDTSVAPASSTVRVTVSNPPAPTSSTVTATGGSFPYGQTATIPVKVTGNGVVPTGSVTVLAGSTPLATATLNAGQATLTVPARSLSPASHVLTLTYSGDAKVKAATGSLTLTVTKATATIDKPTIRPKRIIVNKTKARVLVKVAATGLRPTGKVTIIGKGIRTKTATLRADGTVAVKLAKFKKRGLRKLTISYSGDSYLEAASTTLTVRVKPQAH